MALAEIKTLAETRPLLKKHKINYQKNRHGNRSLSFRRLLLSERSELTFFANAFPHLE